jgi:hypothetical protein
MDFDSSISQTPDGSNSLAQLLAWDDAAGIELAVVMAPPDAHPITIGFTPRSRTSLAASAAPSSIRPWAPKR